MKRKANDPDENGHSRKRGRKRKSFVIKTTWDGRCAMLTLLNEIRNGEWSGDSAREQRCCIDAIVGYIKTYDLEKRLEEMERIFRVQRDSLGGSRR